MRIWTIGIVAACRLAAQAQVDSLVERIERLAGQEERRLGLDTRITAAEKLRVIAPDAARKLLEGGLPQIGAGEPDSFSYRLLNAYAALDLDEAEKAFAKLRGNAWSYTALISQATAQRDFTRAIRLTRAARADGQYSLGVLTHLIETLAAEDRGAASALQDELVEAFPGTKARLIDVELMLRYAAQAPPLDPVRGRKAARLAMEALDDDGVRSQTSTEYDDTATFTLKGRKVETKTSYETALLQAAAFLAAFDPVAFRGRKDSLPAWKSDIAELAAVDLPAVVRAPRLRRSKPVESAAPKPAPAPDYARMAYDQLIDFAGTAPAISRTAALLSAARKDGIDGAERVRVFSMGIESLGAIPPEARYGLAGGFFREAQKPGFAAALPAAANAYLTAIDAASRSTDRRVASEHDRGLFGRQYAELVRLADEGRIVLPKEHPAIEAQRALREIEKLQMIVQDFSLADQDGKTWRLAELQGKVVVLDFWATWCEPCRKALPEVAKLHRDWSGKGVVVLGVDDEKAEVVRSFAAKNGMSYSTLIDPGRRVHDLFGVTGIPAAIVIGRDGKLVERVPHPHNEETFRAALRKAGI